MKKNYLLIIVFFLFSLNIKSQVKNPSKLDLIQGIWEYINKKDEIGKAYTIKRGMNSLSFAFDPTSNKLDFPLSESIEGFHDVDLSGMDSFNVNLLKNDGLCYIDIEKKYIQSNGFFNLNDCVTPEINVQDDVLSEYGGKELVEYTKIYKLPNDALKLLYNRGKQDKRNYIKDYLDIEVIEITVPKSTVYSLPDKPTAIQLSKGDVVTVIEEKGEWLKVDYGTDNPGWIKREDAK